MAQRTFEGEHGGSARERKVRVSVFVVRAWSNIGSSQEGADHAEGGAMSAALSSSTMSDPLAGWPRWVEVMGRRGRLKQKEEDGNEYGASLRIRLFTPDSSPRDGGVGSEADRQQKDVPQLPLT